MLTIFMLMALLLLLVVAAVEGDNILPIYIEPDDVDGTLGVLVPGPTGFGFPTDYGYRGMPNGWFLWAEYLLDEKSRVWIGRNPVPHIAYRSGFAGAWSMNYNYNYAVQPGQRWTFTAVIAARKWSWVGNNYVATAIVGKDANGNVVNWSLAEQSDSGTFAWKRVSVTVMVPPQLYYLQPRFHGTGGGEFFVSAADFSRSSSPANLPVPSEGLPPSLSHLKYITANKADGIYNINETITWRVGVWGTSSEQFQYSVVDAYGKPLSSGLVQTGGYVQYTPQAPGYYELRVGSDFKPDVSPRYCSAIDSAVALPQPSNWFAGCNPFGAQAGDALYSNKFERLGLSWDRFVAYNLLNGSHSQLPTDFEAFANAYENLVSQGLDSIFINTIEVWNEPNNELGSDWTIQQFVQTVSAARTGAKRADPNVKLAVNFEHVRNMPPNVKTFDTFFSNGGKDLCEVMTLHPYMPGTWSTPPWPQSPEAGNTIWWVSEARSLLASKGINNMEIWSSEYGWPIIPDSPKPCAEIDQARYIVRCTILQLACGVKRVNMFRITDVPNWDSVNGTYGLVRAMGGPRPSLAAYSILAQTVNDLPYKGWLDFGANNAVFVFGNTNKTVMALWRPCSEKEISLNLPNVNVTVTEMFGVSENAPSIPLKIKVGPSPKYLTIAASPQTVASSLGKSLRMDLPWAVFPYSDTIEISEVKKLPDYNTINTSGTVTAVFGDVFYIQAPNRKSGIRVYMPGHSAQRNKKVIVTGAPRTNVNGERELYGYALWVQESQTAKPLSLNNRAVGGGAFHYQQGVVAGEPAVPVQGLNNIGLLIKTCGKVISVDTGSNTFIIDDGSEVFLKCAAPTSVQVGNLYDRYLCVTGISSCEKFGNLIRSLILLRDAADVSIISQ